MKKNGLNGTSTKTKKAPQRIQGKIKTSRSARGAGYPANAQPDQLDCNRLLGALMAIKRGDFTARLPDDWTGMAGKIADTFNDVVRTNERMTRELKRIRHVVGKEGRITQRASLGDVSESW